jgi:hypothetical protein
MHFNIVVAYLYQKEHSHHSRNVVDDDSVFSFFGCVPVEKRVNILRPTACLPVPRPETTDDFPPPTCVLVGLSSDESIAIVR